MKTKKELNQNSKWQIIPANLPKGIKVVLWCGEIFVSKNLDWQTLLKLLKEAGFKHLDYGQENAERRC
ncbi:hypothetical protein [endosymbiont DhMRE of Dentiscutata heterogama]|uniref:hypothetical protein n=1 Tax=endosymbiont DhMRE of Dentiscutata heterogama TaxID=1609546 RepID=UPI002AD4A916|nr:hypothetical protein [endosymbiont DhMRE of Dentiscutata heterogama]